MKTKSSKLLKVCSVLAALVFFLTALLFPVKAFAASADGYNPGPAPNPNPDPNPNPGPPMPDPEPQLPIYYISDSSASASIAWDIEDKKDRAVHLTQFDPTDKTPDVPGDEAAQQRDALNALCADVDFSEIEESYVIFEFETPFAIDADNTEKRVPDILYDIFSDLKANDCYIMFICGTDEYLFRDNNAFLDYVDIHVNTDKLGTFYMSVLHQAAQDYDMQISHCVFFLDLGIAQDPEPGYRKCEFVEYYFVRYIKTVYMDAIRNGGNSVQKVLRDNDIEILCHVQGDEYYDIVNNCTVHLAQEEPLFDQHEWFYAVGTNRNGKEYSEEWITEVRQFCEKEDKPFTVCYYEYMGYDLGNSWYEPTEYGTLLLSHATNSAYLENIMLDFVAGENMSSYNNWSGRCDITHKVGMSNDGDDDGGDNGGDNSGDNGGDNGGGGSDGDGWLVDMMGGGDFGVEGWENYLTDDDADYFDNTANVWED